jgi:hypothetical protein
VLLFTGRHQAPHPSRLRPAAQAEQIRVRAGQESSSPTTLKTEQLLLRLCVPFLNSVSRCLSNAPPCACPYRPTSVADCPPPHAGPLTVAASRTWPSSSYCCRPLPPLFHVRSCWPC